MSSPREDYLHLFSHAQECLPDFGLEGGSLTLIQDLVNSSFKVVHKSGQWFLRIYNASRYDLTTIQSELLWMEALSDHRFPVPRPQPNKSQAFVWVASPNSLLKDRPISVHRWINGTVIPTDKRSSTHFYQLGTLLGQLHHFSTTWSPPPGFSRPHCDADWIYHELETVGQATEWSTTGISKQLRKDLEYARNRLKSAESRIGKGTNRYGLVHGDPSFGNILFDGDQPFLIDFDDCAFGYFIFDLAVVLAGAWGKKGYDENRSALLQGYQQVCQLSDEEVAALPFVMASRAASIIFWAISHPAQQTWVEGQWERLREFLEEA